MQVTSLVRRTGKGEFTWCEFEILTDASRDIYIHVVLVSAVRCADYSLVVTGSAFTPPVTCFTL
jgi:hypothetical protein